MSNYLIHPKLELLAVERTGWRRLILGRWVYSSEPFRRDIQRECAKRDIKMMLHPTETLGPEWEEKREAAIDDAMRSESGDAHGHHRCGYQDRIAELEATNADLLEALEKIWLTICDETVMREIARKAVAKAKGK